MIKCDDSQLRDRFGSLLARKRNYQKEIIDLVKQYKYVVFYGCGLFFNNMVSSWNAHIGRKLDYCCDSDRTKWGKDFRGAKCLSPEELIAIKDDCVVFVTIGDFEPVVKFLSDKGFPSVNLVYKYDLDISGFLTKCDYRELADKLCQTYGFLSDAQSIKVFDAIVNRVFGDGKDLNVMARVCEKNQYFSPDIVKLTEHESFVDVGAFDGDSLKDFIAHTQGKFDKIFCFELDATNFGLLQHNAKQVPNWDKIKTFNLGAWDDERDITYSIENFQSAIGTGEGKGHVVPLDDVLAKEKITYIKMDIEGAEPQALRGVRKIIQSQKPRLAVCIYHDLRHLWEIPIYLKELVPEYKIYLRHHTKLEYETVCYAIL
jgi:FkbM family methyltransferase